MTWARVQFLVLLALLGVNVWHVLVLREMVSLREAAQRPASVRGAPMLRETCPPAADAPTILVRAARPPGALPSAVLAGP